MYLAFHRQAAGSRQQALLAGTCQTPVYVLWLPWTCIRIFNRSSGATAVLDLRQYHRLSWQSQVPRTAVSRQNQPYSPDAKPSETARQTAG